MAGTPGFEEIDIADALDEAAGSAAEDPILSIDTPYGPAIQGTSKAALAARADVEAGAPLYRVGTLGKSQAAEAQFWSFQHPMTPGFAGRYGKPPENVTNADFLEEGNVPRGVPFISREAPAVGTNPGGGIEVVVPPGGVDLKWCSIFDPKGF